MPELENQPERTGNKINQRIEELERTVKALVKAVGDAEKEIGEPLMPAGEYYGTKFE